MKHTLHLTSASRSRPASVARGIRDCLARAGKKDAELVQLVERLSAQAAAGELPLGLIISDDEVMVRAALRALEDGSHGAAKGTIDLPTEEVEAMAAANRHEPATEDELDFTAQIAQDEGISMEAVSTALLLLAYANGNIATTYAQAHSLARTTGDPELYAEVARLLVTAFNINFDS